MADISILSRLVNGIQRNVDLSTNTLVVDKVKFGGGSGTDLSKAILDRLISLQDGSDVGASYHTHDSRYFTESELSSATSSSGSDLIGDDNTYTNFTPAASTVKGALAGIDSALATSSDGKVKVSGTDTTKDYLSASITAGSGLSSTITNPGADEVLDLAVNVDGSTIEINADTLRVKDAGITNAKIATGIDAAKIADGSVSNTEFQYLDGVTSSIQTQINSKAADSIVIKKDGSVPFTAAQSMGGFKLTNVADPTAAQDAATKAYVDANLQGLKPKEAVRAGTTGPIDLSHQLEAGDAIDGVTLVAGDRVLVKDQALPEENGVYVVQASGAAVRATDFDSLSPIDEVNGAYTFIQEGGQAGQGWVQQGTVSTIGVDPIAFVHFNDASTLTGGDMITKTGNNLSVDLATDAGLESSNPGNAAGQLRVKLDGSTLARSASGLKVADAGITETQLATSVAGAGLSGGAGSALSVNVDASTIEINTDTLRVKDLGVTAAKLAADSVTTSKILDANVTLAKMAADSVDENKIKSTTMSASGAITGGSGTKLAVAVDSSTIEISANALRVKDAGITLAKLAADSVDENKIKSSSHDASLSGGSGTVLSVASSPRGLKSMVAGESMAANTSFLVRFALTGETAGRVYKADKDATSVHAYMAIGIALKTSAVSAGDSVDVTFEGTHTLGSSDTPFSSSDIGKPVYLTASGGFSVTAPTSTNEAVWRVGIVESTTKIWVGTMQLNGIN